MGNSWFQDCRTLDDVRKKYRELAKQFHPDMGGNTRTMQEINAAYDAISKAFVRQAHPNKSQAYYREADRYNQKMREVILELLKLTGLKIEVCGSWIWVGGDTFKVHEHLFNLGLKWAPKKQLWFWAGSEYHGKKPLPIEAIRKLYGSKVIKDEDDLKVRY